ncbi:MAG: hypothetical protein AB7C95_04720 [Synergistaceae bacterium]
MKENELQKGTHNDGQEPVENIDTPEAGEPAEGAVDEGGSDAVSAGADLFGIDSSDGEEPESTRDDTEANTQDNKEPAEGDKPKDDENTPGEPYYTAEEMRGMDWDNYDIKRVPPEILGYVKSLQGQYTRKTQNVSKELKELSAKKAELDAGIVPVTREEDEKLYDLAMQKVQAEYGQDFNEFDDRIMSRVNTVKTEITAQYRMNKKVEAHKTETLKQLQQMDPQNHMTVMHMAKAMQDSLPGDVARFVSDAAAKGNFEPQLKLYRDAQTEFYRERKHLLPPKGHAVYKTLPHLEQFASEKRTEAVNQNNQAVGNQQTGQQNGQPPVMTQAQFEELMNAFNNQKKPPVQDTGGSSQSPAPKGDDSTAGLSFFGME